MADKKNLDMLVFIVSLYDYALYDPAEHIVGFYSSREKAEKQRAFMIKSGLYLPKYDGPSDDFHITPRTVRQLIEGSRKSMGVPGDEDNLEAYLTCSECGYGKIAFNGHNHEYPWATCYTDPEEIFERLDKPADISRFLPKQDQNSGDGIDTSGYDGWLDPNGGLWFRLNLPNSVYSKINKN